MLNTPPFYIGNLIKRGWASRRGVGLADAVFRRQKGQEHYLTVEATLARSIRELMDRHLN